MIVASQSPFKPARRSLASPRAGIPKRFFSFKRSLQLLFVLAALSIWYLNWPRSPKEARFHLLVPATSSNEQLCKLLLSAQILAYPTPVLINYGAPEAEDAYVQHLAKVEGILKYLNSVEHSPRYQEELVLIVDGWDAWFQLPADVLLQRYYQANAVANARIMSTYGRYVARRRDYRQTILFGPDKICWPIDYRRPACWAAPNTTLPLQAFGPQTLDGRGSHNHPRWLNSGTILGPLEDLKALFTATLDEIHANHVTDSDQFYLAEIFGRQEFARLQHRPDLLDRYKTVMYHEDQEIDEQGMMRNPDGSRDSAAIEGRKTEFHVGIDYESSLFQTVAFWKQYLTWMRAADSWPRPVTSAQGFPNQYSLDLSSDVTQSRAPFADMDSDITRNTARSWKDVALLYNIVTRQVPVVVHFTGDKAFRDFWWQKVWYQAQARELREARIERLSEGHAVHSRAGGYTWRNAEPRDDDEAFAREVGGVWSDQGRWFTWQSLCQSYEESLYAIRGDELFHAASKPTSSLEDETLA